jgi:hypothetical protein
MVSIFGLFWMVTGLPIFRPLPGLMKLNTVDPCGMLVDNVADFLKFVFILLDIGPAPRKFLLDPLNFCRTYIFYVKLSMSSKMKTNFKKSATLSTSIPHGSIQMVPEFKRWYITRSIYYQYQDHGTILNRPLLPNELYFLI